MSDYRLQSIPSSKRLLENGNGYLLEGDNGYLLEGDLVSNVITRPHAAGRGPAPNAGKRPRRRSGVGG